MVLRTRRTGAARYSRSMLVDSNSKQGAVQFALSKGKQPSGNPLFALLGLLLVLVTGVFPAAKTSFFPVLLLCSAERADH